MVLQEITLENFRNIKNLTLSFHPDINIFYGDNGNGKTNLLEAIWLLSGLKSFRKAKERELIHHEDDFFLLKGKFSTNRQQVVGISYREGKKQLTLNQVKKASVKDFIGKFLCVVFSPNDLFLLKEGPAERRDFLDQAISQIKPSYNEILNQYKKVLVQKNNLLKVTYGGDIVDLLEVYNAQLAKLGTVIHFTRVNYLKELQSFAKTFYSGISGGKEELDLSYESTVFESGSTYSQESVIFYEGVLNKAMGDECKARRSVVGIHRDDISFTINKKDAKKFASQGQQRSIILSLKLSESNMIYKNTKEKPIVLLDDVMSELDEKRQDYLLNHFEDTQVFITCCDKSLFDKLKSKANIYNVSEGTFQKSEEM